MTMAMDRPAPADEWEVRKPMRLRHGVCHQLEDEADRILCEALRGITSREAKSDILTPWKLEDRTNREVLTSTGVADPAVRSGMFRKAWNPKHSHLNSREGYYPVRRFVTDGMDEVASVYDGED
jgi:hypothetical protein